MLSVRKTFFPQRLVNGSKSVIDLMCIQHAAAVLSIPSAFIRLSWVLGLRYFRISNFCITWVRQIQLVDQSSQHTEYLFCQPPMECYKEGLKVTSRIRASKYSVRDNFRQ